MELSLYRPALRVLQKYHLSYRLICSRALSNYALRSAGDISFFPDVVLKSAGRVGYSQTFNKLTAFFYSLHSYLPSIEMTP